MLTEVVLDTETGDRMLTEVVLDTETGDGVLTEDVLDTETGDGMLTEVVLDTDSDTESNQWCTVTTLQYTQVPSYYLLSALVLSHKNENKISKH